MIVTVWIWAIAMFVLDEEGHDGKHCSEIMIPSMYGKWNLSKVERLSQTLV